MLPYLGMGIMEKRTEIETTQKQKKEKCCG